MVSIYIYNKNRVTPGPGRGGRLLGILMCSIQREYEELRSVTQGGIVIHSICSTPPEIGSELTKALGMAILQLPWKAWPSKSLTCPRVHSAHCLLITVPAECDFLATMNGDN